MPFERLVFVANPDEEIGSPSSTPHIVEQAADMDVALVLECARANGDIVSARKGIVDLRLAVHGRAAHAGVEPEKGRSAILEAARIVRAVHELNGRWPGVTVNVGVIAGGTRPNVVAESCSLEIDVRATEREALETAEAEIRRIAEATEVPDTTVEFGEMARWWPMEKLERSGRLVDHAKSVATALGFELADAATGGASDANTTSGLGVPSLDGLGPIGGNDHAPAEYLEVDSIVPRTTLLAGLLLAIAADPEVLAWRESRASGARGAASHDRAAADRRRAARGRPRAGYSRALAIGDSCWVAGTTDAGPDGRSRHPGDVAAQARAILEIIERALAEAGFGLDRHRAHPDVRDRHRVVPPRSSRSMARSSGRSVPRRRWSR